VQAKKSVLTRSDLVPELSRRRKKCATAFGSSRTVMLYCSIEETGKIHKTREATRTTYCRAWHVLCM